MRQDLEVVGYYDSQKAENKKKAMTWNSLKKLLPEMGYEVEETTQRENGKRAKMYYIKGQWKDIEPKDRELEQLISAKLVT